MPRATAASSLSAGTLGLRSPEEIDHRAAHLRVGEVGESAARGHPAVPVDRRAHGVVESVLEPRNPGVTIADLGRAAFAAFVALDALRLDDLLAGARRGRGFLVHGLCPLPH